MPKISAATVAAHRAQQRQALLDAAARLLATSDAAALTLSGIAHEAGISRTSVYDYFPSLGELLAALALDAFPEWTVRLARAVSRARTPSTKVAAYVDQTLALMASGEHRLASALDGLDVSAETRRRLADVHDALLEPLRQALDAAGDQGRAGDPEVVVHLVYGALNAAMQLVDRGADPRQVSRTTTAFLSRALAARS